MMTMLFCVSINLLYLCVSPSYGLLINGDFSDGLSNWSAEGDVAVEDGVAVLRTGGISGPFITSLSTDFRASGDILTFRYSFDIIGDDDILYPDFPSYNYDFLEMDLDAGAEGYFPIALAWRPTDGFVPFSMDISSITPGTRAKLNFMLFDGDDKYFSEAAIDGVSDSAKPLPEPGTLLLLGGGLVGLFIYRRRDPPISPSTKRGLRGIGGFVLIMGMVQIWRSGVAHGEFIEENVDDRITLEFTSPLFNTRTNLLTLDLGLTNVSSESLFTPLKVVITGISTPDVTVANPDGYTPDGKPLFDLTSTIDDKELSPGEKAPLKKISFYNPKRVKFRWDQDVLAFVDVYMREKPVIDSICLVPGEAPPLCEYYYKDLGVEDPDFERLPLKPLPEMYRDEQLRVYAFDNEDLPIDVTINGTEASYSEEGFYYYSDVVLKNGLNTMNIWVTNSEGLSANRDVSLNIDSIPPAIDVLEPANGSIVTIPDQVIRGTVDDPGVDQVTLRKDFIASEEVPVIDRTFSKNITLSPGHNDIRIMATDTAGNTTDHDLDIVYVYSEEGGITGRIYNSILNLPIAGATVTAIWGEDIYKTAESGADGGYRIDGVKSGDLTIVVEKEGYKQGRLSIFSPGGATPYTQDVALMPLNSSDTFTLTGQVTDRGGRPLAGASITIQGTSLFGISDDNGIYIITGIPRASFVAEAFRKMYEAESLNVNAGIYSSKTTILTYNFALQNTVNAIAIVSPADGDSVSGDAVMVIGLVRSEGRDVGVRVNGVLAEVYNGYFMANDIPLAEGVNRITAEMIDPSGTLLSDSIEVILPQKGKGRVTIHAQEAGIVPIGISIGIEGPPGASFVQYRMEASGSGTTELISDGPLQHQLFIREPGMYTVRFNAVDSQGNEYEDTFGFVSMAREDVERPLKDIWTKLKDSLMANRIEDALALFTTETRGRYADQFLLLGDRLPDIFANMADIQLISLKDNVAKTRIYEAGITHYIWFVRDIYGLWKIHKF